MPRSAAISTIAMAIAMMVGTIFLGRSALGQFPPPPPAAPAYVPRGIDDLEQLVAPIALYPDAVLAQVLVACTYPQDVLNAATYLSSGNSSATIDAQPWDLSVKGVARYPGTLNYLSSHIDWMNDLGDAFLNQQADVMSAVQILRAQANVEGNLVSNTQQQVITDSNVIEIIPTNPQMIYVPQYDPTVVYVDRPVVVGGRWTPLVTFGVGITVGDWLCHDLDWHDHTIYTGNWGRDRPWWHVDPHAPHRYVDFRPGTYRPTGPAYGHPIIVQGGRWTRDPHRPPPHPVRTVERPPDRRIGTGYPARPPEHPVKEPPRTVVVPRENHGPITARESDRGRESREAAHPAPAAHPVAPTPRVVEHPAPVARPVAPAPRVVEHPAPAARPAPAPAARPSEPSRGEAIHGYQNGEAASHNSERGTVSRGEAPQGRPPAGHH